MGFLFFGRKRSESDKAVEHVNQISANLKDSFIRVKADIKVVRDWLSFFKDKDGEYNRRFDNIESRMEEMSQVVAYLAERDQELPKKQPQRQVQGPHTVEQPYYDTPLEVIPVSSSSHAPLEDLTETQRAIFFRLGAFQRESGQDFVPLKALALDIYPGKSYGKVRSTVSEYVGILVDMGMIKKIRKGKQTYIGITDKGKSFFQKNEPKQTKKATQKRAKKGVEEE